MTNKNSKIGYPPEFELIDSPGESVDSKYPPEFEPIDSQGKSVDSEYPAEFEPIDLPNMSTGISNPLTLTEKTVFSQLGQPEINESSAGNGNLSLPEKIATPFSKLMTGESLSERTNFVEKAKKAITAESVKTGKFPSSKDYMRRLALPSIGQAAVEMADVRPLDIGLGIAMGGVGKAIASIPIRGVTLGSAARHVPIFQKGFMENLGKLSSVEKTMKLHKLDPSLIQGGDAITRLNEMLVTKPAVAKKLTESLIEISGKAKVELLDKYAPVRWLQDRLRQDFGVELKHSKKPYEAMRQFAAEGDIINGRLEVFKGVLDKHKENLGPLKQMLLTERFLERARRGIPNPKGETLQDTINIMGDLRKGLGNERFNAVKMVAEEVRETVLRPMLKDARDSGLISRKSYRNILEKGQFYTPLDILEHMGENARNLPVGKNGFNVSKPGALKATVGTEKAADDPIASIARYIQKVSIAADKNRAVRKLTNFSKFAKDDGKGLVIPLRERLPQVSDIKQIPEGFDKIYSYKDGIKEEFAIPTYVAEAVKGLNAESVDLMTKFASAFTRTLRTGATTLNLPFAFTNPLRDIQMAMNLSKVGFTPLDFVKGVASVIRKDADFKLFLKSRGGQSGYISSMRGTTPQLLRDLTPSISSQVLKVLNPLNLIEGITNAGEMGTRVGLFKRALKAGKNPIEAGFIARDTTIDFAKSGTKMKILNMWIPFLNARTQASANIIDRAKNAPASLALRVSGTIGVPALATYAWNQMTYPDVWKDIRQFEKDNNFIFIYGRDKDREGKYADLITIPKGELGQIFSNPLEAFLDYLYLNKPIEAQKLIMQTMSNVSPVSFARGGELSGLAVGSSILPTPAKAVVETTLGKNLYTGRDIVPPYIQYMHPKPEEQYDEASAIAIKLGDFFNISPLKIENLASTLAGGAGKQILDPSRITTGVLDKFKGAWGGAEQDLQFDILEDIERDSGDIAIKSFRYLKQAKQDWEDIPAVPYLRRQFIKERFSNRPEKEIKKFMTWVTSGAEDEMPIYRALRSAKVADRAQFVKEYIQTLDDDNEKLLFLEDILKHKILSEKVYLEIIK